MPTSFARRAGAAALTVTTVLAATVSPAVAGSVPVGSAEPPPFSAPVSSRFVLLSGCDRPTAPDLHGEWQVTAEYAVEFTGGRYSIPSPGGPRIDVGWNGHDAVYRARIDQKWIYDRAGFAALGPGSTSEVYVAEVHVGDPGAGDFEHVISAAGWVTLDSYTCRPA